MEIESPLQIASDKLIAWTSLVWHYNKTCFPALEWHWELLKIIFPGCQYPFQKAGGNRTNWNSVAVARSYIPAGKSISGVMLTAVFITPAQPLYYSRCTPCASKWDLLPSLLDFSLYRPPGYSPTTDRLHIIIYCTPFFAIVGYCQQKFSLFLGRILKTEHTLGGAH